MTFETKCGYLNKKQIWNKSNSSQGATKSWSAKVLFCMMNFLHHRPISLRNTCEKSSLLLIWRHLHPLTSQ